MAGARIGPISGVNWAAYGNVASLIMQAAEASARGSAALGAGIGGGLQSLGHGIQRGRERREDRADRKEQWTAELNYRKDRDRKDDTRADLRLSMDAANIAEDNERIRTQGEIELLNRLMATSAQKATLADQTGNVQGFQAAIAEGETLGVALQSRLAKMLKINALPGAQPAAAQPANTGPVDWEGLFANSAQGAQGRAFLQRAPSAETQRDAAAAYPGRPVPAASSMIERKGETPSMARRRLEDAAVEREGMRLSGDQGGYRKALMPNGLPDDPMEVARTVVSQTANPAAKRAELMVSMLDTKIAALEQGKQSIGNKTPQELIARRAHDRAQSILTNTKLPFLAVVDIGKQRGMALKEAQARQEGAAKRASDAQGEKSSVEAAMAAFQAKHGRGPYPQEAELIWRQVHGGVKPDTAVENFPKSTQTGDSDEEMRKAGAERLKSIDSEAGKIRDVLSRNSQPKASGGEVYDLGQHTNLGAYSTEALVSAWANTANEQTRAFYEKELGSRKDANEAKRAVASLRFSNLPKAEQTKEKWDKIKASLGL